MALVFAASEPSSGLIALVGEAEPGLSPEAAALRLDLAGYLYFCLTLVEVFGELITRPVSVRSAGSSAGCAPVIW